MFRMIMLVVSLACATSAASAATSASPVTGPTLSVSKGTVLVSNGGQFVTAKPGQVLKAGDRVMVMQGGNATLNYGNGHTSALPSGTLADVGASNVNTFGSRGFAGQQKIGPMYAQAVGDNDHSKCHDSQGRATTCPAEDEGDNSFILPVVSTVVIGSALYLALHSTSNHHISISTP